MPWRGEEVARQVHVFGGDPHLAVVAQAERGRDVVEIGHAAHVDPGLRHRDHDIGEAEAQPLDHHHALVHVGDHLAQQILAGDAEMDRALRQRAGDLAGREIGDLDAGQSGDRAAIVARAARLDQRQAGAGEERLGVLLQPALGRHGDDERRAHGCASAVGDALDPDRKADRGDRRLGAEPGEQFVVAAAGDQRPVRRGRRIVQLEHEAGVVVEAAAIGGREADAADIDAARGEKAGAAFEQIERRLDAKTGRAGERAQFGRGLVGIAGDGEEFFDQRPRRAAAAWSRRRAPPVRGSARRSRRPCGRRRC